jgi:short-subunit dehydrogenase
MAQEVALITGASSGIGEEAGPADRDGRPVVPVARRQARLESIAAELRVEPRRRMRCQPT